MADFIAPKWQALLAENALGSVDAAWTREVAWVEAPNDGRGGLSGVGRVNLPSSQGHTTGAFLKRQQNHTRPSWKHPLRGEATFKREFDMVQHLQAHGVPTLEPMLFGERYVAGEVRAVLMTVALDGYQPLDVLAATEEFGRMSPVQKRQLLAATAHTVRQMHLAGVQHRSLYAKHLFAARQGEGYRVVVIDLEKSRFSWLPVLRTLHDLVTLNYRTPGWSRTQRLYFFKQYYAINSLKGWQRTLCKLIARRSRARLKPRAK
ncbi:lipopolysaccharide kinase InaA family protein [Methylovorus menthalis]|uniref:lipopolysaccharide kinase InaA family protein n=1 Tax=Methylovorus menthalis TaxID=1002227 RepID=UPI001E522105|nr:lipopolysaccharide kinase InaA family protein [Methylovorus menthalis]MCB4811276.1 lipopolysaccharide kinase InaA family protein [Methylovorus menthalis]